MTIACGAAEHTSTHIIDAMKPPPTIASSVRRGHSSFVGSNLWNASQLTRYQSHASLVTSIAVCVD